MNVVDRANEYFLPNEKFVEEKKSNYKEGQQKIAFWVGLIAIGLPMLLFLSRYFEVLPRDSISHYFFVPWLGTIFVMSLAFIGTFLVNYQGASALESALATLAGWCAFGVALLPTSGAGLATGELGGANFKLNATLLPAPTEPADALAFSVKHGVELERALQLADFSSKLHLVFAAVLFAILAIYSFVIFTRPEDGVSRINGKLTTNKTWRNRIYNATGFIIVGCIAAIAANKLGGFWNPGWDENDMLFWCEAFALAAFGFAWMVKGRFWFGYLED